jgi:enoyl-CoA hydratase
MVALRQEKSVATVVISRPDHLNALPVEGWERLGEVVHGLAQEKMVRAVVIRGEGAKAFSTGIDLKELSQRSAAEASRALVVVEETLLRVEHLPMPTIAVLDGWVLGAGCELALACDLRLATLRSQIGLPMAKLGLMASSRLLSRLVGYVGPGIAKELLFTGRTLTAFEANGCGLVNFAVAPEAIDAVLAKLLSQISGSSLGALKAAKRAVALGSPVPSGSWALQRGPSYFIDPVDFPIAMDAFVKSGPPVMPFAAPGSKCEATRERMKHPR